MNEITVNNYETLKNELGKELVSTAQSVCRIGYLLKLARDTEILTDKYADVYDFASSEYGLDKSQVSRFMNINDRFSVGGNSEELLPEYSQYGSSKLSIMLTLPDEINEELSPDMTKSDIMTIKEEYEEEKNTTPIERMTEDTSNVPDDFIEAVVKTINDEFPEPAELMKESIDLAKSMNLPDDYGFENDAKEAYMPDGDKTYIIGIPGKGRHIVKFTEDHITITSMVDMEKSDISWEEFTDLVIKDVNKRDFKEEKPKEKTKPKKVEKAKKPEKTPTKSAPTACQPAEPVDVWEEEPKEAAGDEANEAAGDESNEAGTEEHTGAAGDKATEAAGTENHTEAAGEITALRKQVADKLDQVKDEVVHGESWEIIRDHVRDISKFITVSAF